MDDMEQLEDLLPQAGAHFLESDRERARHEMQGPFMLPPGPTGFSFALYQPDLSELLHRVVARVLDRIPEEWPPPGTLATLGRLLAFAGGRRVWSKKFAPP